MTLTIEEKKHLIETAKATARDSFSSTDEGMAPPIATVMTAKPPSPEAVVEPGEEGKPFALIVAMPDLSDEEQRLALMDMARELDALFITVVAETWSVLVPKDDIEGLEALEKARRARDLTLMPKKYLREQIRIFAEGPDYTLECWAALITRDEKNARTLGDWEKLDITLPRPTFRRYFPEVIDGVPVIRIPPMGEPPVRA